MIDPKDLGVILLPEATSGLWDTADFAYFEDSQHSKVG